jgi:hypothetical protein
VAYGTGSTITAYTSGEKGVRLRFAHPIRISGFWTTHDPDVDVTYNLYADSTAPGGAAIRSVTIATNRFIQKNAVVSQYSFSSSVTLAANTWYRLVGLPAGGVGTRFSINTIPLASYASAVATDHHLTESSGVSWIDSPTILPQIGVVANGFDDGIGGGSYSPIDNILIG